MKTHFYAFLVNARTPVIAFLAAITFPLTLFGQEELTSWIGPYGFETNVPPSFNTWIEQNVEAGCQPGEWNCNYENCVGEYLSGTLYRSSCEAWATFIRGTEDGQGEEVYEQTGMTSFLLHKEICQSTEPTETLSSYLYKPYDTVDDNGCACAGDEWTKEERGGGVGCFKKRPPDKDDDPCKDDGDLVGNPCSVSTGAKFAFEVDFTNGFTFQRIYNSRNVVNQGVGEGWRHNFQSHLTVADSSITYVNQNGRGEPWHKYNGAWLGEADTKLSLLENASGFEVTQPTGVVEQFSPTGKILSMTDPQGKQTTFNYNVSGFLESVTNHFGLNISFTYIEGNIETVTDPSGQVYTYQYDSNNNLAAVIYPDDTPGTLADNPRRIYHYGETPNYPNHLSGITDENGDRYATYNYNSDGKAILTQHAQTTNAVGQETFQLDYTSATTTTVTDAGDGVNLGTQEVHTFEDVLGAKRLTSKINQTDMKGLTQVWDPVTGNLTSRTDPEGRVTKYFYNANNQKTSMIEAFGTSEERTTTYDYVSPDVDLVTKVYTPSIRSGLQKTVRTGYTAELNVDEIEIKGYNAQGVPVSRLTSFQHDSLGRVTEIDGPRTDVNDVTIMTYYPNCTTGGECGQLETVTNALGHVTTYDDYDAAGRLKQSTDPNGVVTTYTYHVRGWVSSITMTPPPGSLPDDTPRTISYQYDDVGQLTEVTQADGSKQHYVYDEAHDLRRIYDDLGNQVEYLYDARGNRSDELFKDPDGVLELSVTQSYDSRNFLETINRGGSITQSFRDANGVVNTRIDPKQNPATDYDYDDLDRLSSIVDALTNTTSYQYDVADNLTQVTAPNNATTDFEYDDLGNLTKETSSDRGVIMYTHDGAGNVVTMTDARGVVTTYGYDALNRLTSLTYPQASENVTYTYDLGTECGAALGRLCQVVDASGTHTYTYDAWGNLLKHARNTGVTTLETHYAYDALNRITQLVYPSGLVIDYQRDAIGRVSAVHAPKDSLTEIVADEFAYRVDGQVTSTRLGNDQTVTRHYDALGRLDDQWIDNTQIADYGYDANSNLTSRVDQDQERSFGYDFLDRLETDDRITGLSSANWEFEYDANGNRTETDQSGTISPLIYTPNSNRLATLGGNPVVTDAAGNTTSLPRGGSALTLAYNQQNHLASITKSGVTTHYTTNHQRQRLTKSSAGATTHYVYDLNGRLLATTDANGMVDEEYVYANEVSFSPIYHRLYEDTEANTVEAAQALEKSEQSIADPVDSQGQCNGYERTESDRNNSSARSFNNADGGVLVGGTDVFNIPNQNIGWFIPILMLYLDDGPPEIIDLDDEEVEPEPVDQHEIIVTWTPAPVVLEHVVDVATTKRALNNQPDVARHCVQSNENQVQINHIPLNGTKVYVRLWSKDNGVWTYEDFEFETTGSSDPRAYVTRTYLVDDHLNTPRLGYDDEQTLTWRWASDGFGSEVPRDDADSDGIQNNINIRFPGQYYDYESGLNYNWNRYYDPETGRYVTSDPIGLEGGLNTFGYVGGNPLTRSDFKGLAVYTAPQACGSLRFLVVLFCKDATTCSGSDSCAVLDRKAQKKSACLQYQLMLTSICYPDDPTHQERIAEMQNGIRRCLRIWTQNGCGMCRP